MYRPIGIIEILLALLVITAALIDFRQRRVPNWLALAGLIVGVGMNWFLCETPGLRMSLKGFGALFGLYFVLYLLRAMGAGDVKLMGAVGAIVGYPNCLGILVMTLLLGGIAAAVLVVGKGRIRKTLHNIWTILSSLRVLRAPYQANPELDVASEQALRLPHAVVVASGTFGFLIAAAIWATGTGCPAS